MPAIVLVKHGPCPRQLRTARIELELSVAEVGGDHFCPRVACTHLPLVGRAPLDRGFEGSFGACMGIIECSTELIGEIVS
jgi:hypothetical protein